MIQFFDDAFKDPFKISDAPSGHVNFATGVTASSQIEQNLLSAFDTGNRHASKFINERSVITEGNTTSSKSFYEP